MNREFEYEEIKRKARFEFNQLFEKNISQLEKIWNQRLEEERCKYQAEIEVLKNQYWTSQSENQTLRQNADILDAHIRKLNEKLKREQVHRVASDFITAYDMLCQLVSYHAKEVQGEELDFLKNLQEILIEEFRKMGCLQIIHSREGDSYDPNLHLSRTSDNVTTNQPELDGTIAGTIESGYKINDSIIQKEKVALYEYCSSFDVSIESPRDDEMDAPLTEMLVNSNAIEDTPADPIPNLEMDSSTFLPDAMTDVALVESNESADEIVQGSLSLSENGESAHAKTKFDHFNIAVNAGDEKWFVVLIDNKCTIQLSEHTENIRIYRVCNSKKVQKKKTESGEYLFTDEKNVSDVIKEISAIGKQTVLIENKTQEGSMVAYISFDGNEGVAQVVSLS